MAWKYREIEFEAGDVLDPGDWNRNVEAYAEEINGFLDRDNLRTDQVRVGTELSQNSSTTGPMFAFAQATSTTEQTLNLNSTGWQQVDDLSINIPAQSDELLIVDCGLYIQHDHYNRSDPDTGNLIDHLHVEGLITVDGFEVAYGGPIAAYYTHMSLAMFGVLPVSAGAHDVKVHLRLGREDYLDYKWDHSNGSFCKVKARNLLVLRRIR